MVLSDGDLAERRVMHHTRYIRYCTDGFAIYTIGEVARRTRIMMSDRAAAGELKCQLREVVYEQRGLSFDLRHRSIVHTEYSYDHASWSIRHDTRRQIDRRQRSDRQKRIEAA